ncbi:LysR family transcriptional regulator [Caballeronia sp. LZ043]|uniref:LysR family transcriptional regulator n=1 Tax=Caballeronia sp. LZ043 TaxID=3038569 RepID=UPI00285BBC85|nr:LysR family transcriptional regulator [Caballeronia sp. LZ043]MDR5826203.1 LysR family transcriptional regulator [Caballeronia sp. LZ043]
MDTLQSMRIFVRIVEAGTFTAAARSLMTSPGVLSRAMSDLEGHLRTRLLNRTTRRLVLTTAGEQYLKRCWQILADINDAEEEASGAREHPAGVLRMHSFASIGQQYVLPAISKYRALYPDVTVELVLSQRKTELFDGNSDVSIVTGAALPDSELVSHKLGATCSILCASPGYIQTHGAPRLPSDLANHDCLILTTPTAPTHEWVLEGPDGNVEMRVNGPVQVNIAESLAVAIREGSGIGMLPVYAAVEGLRNGSLVRVLPQYILHKSNVYALYPSRRYVDAKTKTWVDFFRAHLPSFIARDMALLETLTRAQLADPAAPLVGADGFAQTSVSASAVPSV